MRRLRPEVQPLPLYKLYISTIFSRNHVTDLSTESGNLFKMAAKIKSERIWVRGLETGEKQTKWRQRQNSKEAKNMKEYTYKPQEYGRMI